MTRMGLWRSWERASMAWKRSTVRTRPGPPNHLQLDTIVNDALVPVELIHLLERGTT